MLGPQMMGGGGGGGIVLPGMAMRGRGHGDDDYGGGRPLGPNGQTVEPLNKRPRWVETRLVFIETT